MNRIRTVLACTAASVVLLLLLESPAGAQQPVDATTQGGLSFVLFALMVFIFTAIIFSFDRVRRGRKHK